MMKKILAAAVCLLFCVGCGGGSVQPQSNNLAFGFDFQSGEDKFSVNADINGGGDISFTVLEPESIREFKVVFSGDTVETEFLGVKKEFPLNDTDFGIFSQIYRAFSGLQNPTAESKDGEYTAVVTVGTDTYAFTLTDLGLPISLKINGTDIEFKNVTAT